MEDENESIVTTVIVKSGDGLTYEYESDENGNVDFGSYEIKSPIIDEANEIFRKELENQDTQISTPSDDNNDTENAKININWKSYLANMQKKILEDIENEELLTDLDEENVDSLNNEKEVKYLTPVDNKEIVEDRKVTTIQEKISTLNQNSAIKHHQNQLNTYTDHLNQMNRNQLNMQRTYDKDIAIYENQKSIDEYKVNDQKEELSRIENKSKSLLDKINKDKNHLGLWRYKEKYYCRVCEGIIVDNVEDGITIKEIEKKFNHPTMIVEVKDLITPKTQNITQSKLYQFILLNDIPVVTDIVFNPKENEFFEHDGAIYKNIFIHTKYLEKRFNNRIDSYG